MAYFNYVGNNFRLHLEIKLSLGYLTFSHGTC